MVATIQGIFLMDETVPVNFSPGLFQLISGSFNPVEKFPEFSPGRAAGLEK